MTYECCGAIFLMTAYFTNETNDFNKMFRIKKFLFINEIKISTTMVDQT